METDITTLQDLNAFGRDHTPSLFDKLNFCRTTVGEESLRAALMQPLHSAEAIRDTQQILQLILQRKNKWPDCITNGGLLMIEKFYESPVETIPENATAADAISYRLFHKSDFSLIQFSCTHFFDLLRGLHEIGSLFIDSQMPEPLETVIKEINHHLNQPLCKVAD